MKYPDEPGFKENDTSRSAAYAMAGSAPVLRQRVLTELATAKTATPPGLTADEIAARLRCTVLAIRPRVSELHTASSIFKTGERRRNISGLSAHVWTIP